MLEHSLVLGEQTCQVDELVRRPPGQKADVVLELAALSHGVAVVVGHEEFRPP